MIFMLLIFAFVIPSSNELKYQIFFDIAVPYIAEMF